MLIDAALFTNIFTSVLQACVFDLLDGNMFDADRNVVTLKTSGHQIFNLSGME